MRATLPAGTQAYRITLVANEPDGLLRAPAALPGGYIFVPARMIAETQEEEAFARQLAHAMAHIAEGHGKRVRLGGDTSSIPLIFFTNALDGPPGARLLVPRAMLKMQEQWESEANARAEQMMQSFVPDARFASVQAEIRRLFPLRKAPSLRREGEPVR